MRYIAALDVGTTTIRCCLINDAGDSVSFASEKVNLLYPKPGYVEIDPDSLWVSIIRVIQRCFKESNIDPSQIEGIGISTQRNSIITWNLETGQHYHNFITWKDLRADSLVKEWNASMTMRSLRMSSRVLYTITRRKRFQAGSALKLMNVQMTCRLAWALKHVEGLAEAAASGKAVFGGVDSWILYKLNGRHITDVSCASASGMFDPFTMEWSAWAQMLFGIPASMFPQIVDTAGDFGRLPSDLFGADIPIACSMADQAASLFGSASLKPGDLKVTMGTGSFVNVNTGDEPHASITGIYPLVAYRIGSDVAYVVEGASNDNAAIIEWANATDLFRDPHETCVLANSVNDSDGVYFVPAFSGLQAPFNNHNAASGFIGIKPTTRKAHLVRSMLESLVFRVLLIFECVQEETKYTYETIRVDGGVSKNDFIMQLLADLTGLKVERSISSEVAILGVAFLAGLQQGIWKDKEEIFKIRKIEKIFYPNKEVRDSYTSTIKEWRRAVEKFKDWY